ncbi:MAG: hypothetical protein AAF632_25910 [Bacteroidota bacterium]
MDTPEKSLVFFDSLEQMQDYGLYRTLDWSVEQRLRAMTELNEKLFGITQGDASIPPQEKQKIILYPKHPDETLAAFYQRINEHSR